MTLQIRSYLIRGLCSHEVVFRLRKNEQLKKKWILIRPGREIWPSQRILIFPFLCCVKLNNRQNHRHLCSVYRMINPSKFWLSPFHVEYSCFHQQVWEASEYKMKITHSSFSIGNFLHLMMVLGGMKATFAARAPSFLVFPVKRITGIIFCRPNSKNSCNHSER